MEFGAPKKSEKRKPCFLEFSSCLGGFSTFLNTWWCAEVCWNFNNGVQPKPLPAFQRRLGGRPQVSCRDFRREVCWKSKKVGDFLGIRFLTLRPDQWILKSSARCAVVTPLVDAKSDGGNPNFMAQTAGHTYTTSAKMSNPQDNKSYSYYIIWLCLWRYMYITHMNLCIYIYMNMIEYV